jgi:predicted nucleic acid-binding protein
VFVVDASILVSVLAGAEHAEWVQTQLASASRRSIWAPHVIDAEVGHSLRRRVAARQLDADDARDALGDLVRLPLRRIAHRGLLDGAWALRNNLSFYDALYVTLAEHLELPLLTLDGRLAKAAESCTQVRVRTYRE